MIANGTHVLLLLGHLLRDHLITTLHYIRLTAFFPGQPG